MSLARFSFPPNPGPPGGGVKRGHGLGCGPLFLPEHWPESASSWHTQPGPQAQLFLGAPEGGGSAGAVACNVWSKCRLSSGRGCLSREAENSQTENPQGGGPWGWTPGGCSELTLWTDWRVAPLTHKDQEGVGDGGRAIWPGEATGEAPALPSPTVSAPRPLPPWRQPGVAQDPGKCRGGDGVLAQSGACPAQRGQEARTPGIVSRNRSPAPVREEVLPGALRRCLPGYIVEQETRQRGSRAVEEGARDAEPTRACRGKWRRGRRADAPRCPGKQGQEWGAKRGLGWEVGWG